MLPLAELFRGHYSPTKEMLLLGVRSTVLSLCDAVRQLRLGRSAIEQFVRARRPAHPILRTGGFSLSGHLCTGVAPAPRQFSPITPMVVEKTGSSSPGARPGTQSCKIMARTICLQLPWIASGRLCQQFWLLVEYLDGVQRSQWHHEVKLCRSFFFFSLCLD